MMRFLKHDDEIAKALCYKIAAHAGTEATYAQNILAL
jgi:hypothetical protein